MQKVMFKRCTYIIKVDSHLTSIGSLSGPYPVNTITIIKNPRSREYINVDKVGKIQVYDNREIFLKEIGIPAGEPAFSDLYAFRIIGDESLLKYPIVIYDGIYGIDVYSTYNRMR